MRPAGIATACQPGRPASQCRPLVTLGGVALTLADLADRHVGAGQAERLALRWRGRNGRKREFTYGELASLSDRLAAHLLAQDVRPGQAVGVMLGRQPETVIAALAVWKIGGIYCPLFADLGPDFLQARLDVARIKLLMA